MNLAKVIATGILSTLCIINLNKYLELYDYYIFVSLPALLLLYFGMLQLVKAFDLKNDILSIKQIIKN
jgi:hypothetical protein